MAKLIKRNLYPNYDDFDTPPNIQTISYECSSCRNSDVLPSKRCSKCGVVFVGLYDDNGNMIQHF